MHDEVPDDPRNDERYRSAMLADVRVLAGEIGIRFMGSQGDARAARYIADRFGQTGLTPELAAFPVIGWRVHGQARLEISAAGASSWSPVCYPYVYSSSTAAQGSWGRVVPAGRQELFSAQKFRPFERAKFRFRKYSMVSADGAVLAQIVSRDFPDAAPAAAWGVLPLPRTTPTVMIGEREGRRLEAMVAGQPVDARLTVTTEFSADATACNVIARLPGLDRRKSQEPVLVAAHYDTQYAGPGAVDNASGVACLLSLARYFSDHRPARSILFAAYSGEEVGFVGAKHHVASLKDTEQLATVRAMLNLDMLACNEPNWIHVSDDFLAVESCRRAASDVGITETYGPVEFVTPPWPSGDQDPFYDEGIPCVSFTWKGYRYPHTHTAEDTADKVDAEVLVDSFHLAHRVIEHMDRML